MSADDFPSEFEERLRREEVRGLPAEWREEILDNATTAPPRAKERSLVVALFPRALVIPVAAVWMVIGVLWLTEPGSDGGRAVSVSNETVDEDVIVAWAEWLRAARAGNIEMEEAL